MLFNIVLFISMFWVTACREDPNPETGTSKHPCCRVCYSTAYFRFDIYCFVFIWQQNNKLFCFFLFFSSAQLHVSNNNSIVFLFWLILLTAYELL